ncbi:hypothetical protein CsSME_00023152 [Camellia sinensis var. sinensis]
MDALTLFCTASLIAGGFYWSFFRRPKEIEVTENVPAFVDTFYNLVTDIYKWGWGTTFPVNHIPVNHVGSIDGAEEEIGKIGGGGRRRREGIGGGGG